MRVTFLIGALGYGGAERQLVALATELHRNGHGVRVVSLIGGGELTSDLTTIGIPVTEIGLRGPRHPVRLARALVRLARALRAGRPEIVHGYLAAVNLAALLSRPFLGGARLVWGVRATDIDYSRYSKRTAITYGLESRLARFADLVIANSRAGREAAIGRGFPAGKIVVVPNGINTRRFRRDRAAGRRLRAEWGVADDKILIGLVGRLDPMKDHETFLNAASLTLRTSDEFRFVCVGGGDGERGRRLRALADEQGLGGLVVWAPPTNDMSAVYSALDILTQTSAFAEGFPNVIGEAMAAETPCVVTDVGDSAFIVGDTGVVVPIRDPESVRRAWLRLASADRAEMGARARERVIQEFDIALLMERTKKALAALITTKPIVGAIAESS